MPSIPRLVVRENLDELPPDVKPAVIPLVQALRHEARNITLINIHEFHGNLPVLIDAQTGAITSAIAQQNFVSRMYGQILDWMRTDRAAPPRFLGLVEVDAEGRVVLGGGQTPDRPPSVVNDTVSTLDIAFQCMNEIADKLVAAGREGLAVRTDIRRVDDTSWGRALIFFASLFQQPGVFATNREACEGIRSLGLAYTQDVVDTVVYNRPARSQVDEASLRFASRASRFMRHNMTEMLPNRGLDDMIRDPTLRDVLREMRAVLVDQNLAVRAAEVVSRATAACRVLADNDLLIVKFVASLTARVMDLAMLQWVAWCPDNTTIVVQSGDAHACAISTMLQLYFGFQLKSQGSAIRRDDTNDFLLQLPPFLPSDEITRVAFNGLQDRVAALQAEARRGSPEAQRFLDRLRTRIVLMTSFSDVWAWMDQELSGASLPVTQA